MKFHCYKYEDEVLVFTTELSDFDLMMNCMTEVDSSSASIGNEMYLAEIEGPLKRLLKIMPGTTKAAQLYQLVATFEAMAKDEGIDLGWEHKKTTLYRE